jgi:F0F1-type ATP synthase assembly protein I
MQIAVKIFLSLAIILAATEIARKLPSLAGLLAVMPLTGALVLVWVHLENKGNPEVMRAFSRSAFFGILPTLLFFLAALICYRKHLPLNLVLLFSFGSWAGAALIHQWLVK